MIDLNQIGKNARESAVFMNNVATADKNRALNAMAEAIETDSKRILAANQTDMAQAAQQNYPKAMLDRLLLTPQRLADMTASIRMIAELADPVGEVEKMWRNHDQLLIGKQRVPLGVIGMIYEARPNVTTDAAALCFKAGNAVILRGGKEALAANQTLVQIMQAALVREGFPKYAVQLIEDTSRETARAFMQLNDYLDVLIPRGGAGLIQTVVQTATVPVIETGTGNCHIYIDEGAALDMSADIVVNAKCQRPSACNAAETLLIHEAVAERFLPVIEQKLSEQAVELRADQRAMAYLAKAVPATDTDFTTEFLDLILAVKVVSSIDDALVHISTYGTGHSEVIISNDYHRTQRFLREVDAAAVYVNASSRFTDGGVFGFGGEIGISSQKLHARGPMGLHELTTTKYIIYGEGQIRQ